MEEARSGSWVVNRSLPAKEGRGNISSKSAEAQGQRVYLRNSSSTWHDKASGTRTDQQVPKHQKIGVITAGAWTTDTGGESSFREK